MAEIFHLPKIGDAMAEAEIVEWYVAVGDEVELDQVICSVETDKSVVELSSPYRGTMLAVAGEPGDIITVGRPLCAVGSAGEAVPGDVMAEGSTAAAAARVAGAAGSAVVGSTATAARPTTGAIKVAGVVESPLVRRLAADNGVDVTNVAGSGVGGRVTRADVLRAIEAARVHGDSRGTLGTNTRCTAEAVRAMPKVRRAAREAGIDLAEVAGTGPRDSVTLTDLERASHRPRERRERLSAVRRSIAAHLSVSARTIPQFTAMVDVDAGALLATRAALRERLAAPVPVDAVLMAVMIPVLRDHPIVNARLDSGELGAPNLTSAEVVYFDSYDIGVATDTPDGLMVPVVHDADQLSVAELAGEITRLVQAARDRTIRPDELSGATCTINNVGAAGIEAGTPMLPLGTSTIVAFGAARQAVQLRNGNPVEVPTMTISATFDHRLIDGGTSGRFLSQLKQHLEVPVLGFL